MTRQGPGTSSGKRWTAAEDDELRRVAPTVSFKGMGFVLRGRSRKAVRARLIKLGLYAATSRSPGTYTLMEVSAILGMEWSAVRWWVDQGYLPHIRVRSLKVQTGRGGRILIVDAELDAFITEYPFLFHPSSFPDGPHKGTLIMARPQDWVSRFQAAQLIGMCAAHLTDIERAGRITCRRFGHQVYFHRAEIERYRSERAHRMAVNPGYRNRWLHRKEWRKGQCHVREVAS